MYKFSILSNGLETTTIVHDDKLKLSKFLTIASKMFDRLENDIEVKITKLDKDEEEMLE